MPKKSKIPPRNLSPTGWWIYNEVEHWVSNRQKKLSVHSRTLVWENTRIIKAKNREDAFRKAVRLSSLHSPSKTVAGEWRFVGISMLLPISEELEDGPEVLWTTRNKMTQKAIQNLVKSKKQLPVFDDNEN